MHPSAISKLSPFVTVTIMVPEEGVRFVNGLGVDRLLKASVGPDEAAPDVKVL